MGMRTDCKHYFRKTTQSGGVVEQCAIGRAPDAPERCPEGCPFFEKRQISHAGFVYGSLTPEAEPEDEPNTGEMAVLDDLKSFMDEISDDVVRQEEQSRRSKPRRSWFRRKR